MQTTSSNGPPLPPVAPSQTLPAEFRLAARDAGQPTGSQPPGDVARLRQRYAELAEHARRLAADPRLQHRPLAALDSTLRNVLAISRLVYAELARAENPCDALPASPVVPLLDQAADQLAQIDRELGLLRQIARFGAELSNLAGRLLTERTVSASPLRDLADRLIAEVRTARTPHDLWPGNQIGVRQWLIEHSGVPHAPALVDGLLSVRPLIWVAGQRYRWSRRIEPLTLAALLQDIGLMQLGRGRVMNGTNRRDVEYCHPTVSAALAAGLADCDLELPRLVAAHHERIDGSGRPARLASRQLPEAARLLSVAVRLVELRYGSAFDRPQDDPRGRPLVTAVSSLCREALQGEHDLAVTTRFLSSLGIEIPIELGERLRAGDPNCDSDGRLRHDAAHHGAPPHYAGGAQVQNAAPKAHRNLRPRRVG